MAQTPSTPAEWARVLKRDWERRARHPSRDFFVASHADWEDAELWEAKAETEAAAMLLGLDEDALQGGHMLEIGCGIGRLAGPFLGRVRSYTGIDIAEGMLEEARRRHADAARARFLPCDGLCVPDGARDRAYRFVLALGVLIHCPEPVIAGWIEDGYRVLEPGGVLRFQVLGDLRDPTGIVSQAAAEVVHQQAIRDVEVVTEEQLELIEDTPYMGKRFRYDELRSFVEAHAAGEIELLRTDLVHVYGSIRKPA